MKVTINRLERVSLEDFADRHKLDLVIAECAYGFYAYFEVPKKDLEAQSLHLVKMGHGSTPQTAVADLAAKISGSTIATGSGKEATAPYLTVTGTYE